MSLEQLTIQHLVYKQSSPAIYTFISKRPNLLHTSQEEQGSGLCTV